MSKDILIIKVGTGVLTRVEDGSLNGASLVRLVTAISELVESGVHCVLVSSGAVGAGVSALGLEHYPEETAARQACAAVGQTRLMHAYENLFQKFRLNVAQVLLTAADLDEGKRSEHVLNTLKHLMRVGGIIPIINENDTVATEELRVGDNDMLSAKVARLLDARLLVLLSTIDGVQKPDGSIVSIVENIADIENLVREDHGKFSIGGMGSKLRAVQLALDSGVETVIANGHKPRELTQIVLGQGRCTRFLLPSK